MRISAKGRYALAATICLAESYSSGEYTSLLSISEKLGISKIYLEQIFSQLKLGDVVISAKGPKGGYQLSRTPGQITVKVVLSATELSLFEPFEEAPDAKVLEIEEAIKENIFDPLDSAIEGLLSGITLADMVSEVQKRTGGQMLMYYI